ncbi:MAG: hypothetical protein JWN14_990, partial [Chthonomonadales bacterium]|nr:hypothetical protein [Chthonomonadales bacterium]
MQRFLSCGLRSLTFLGTAATVRADVSARPSARGRRLPVTLLGLLIAIASLTHGHRAEAIPAYANRTGLQCSHCHSPIFPRLTRFGWEFRRMGYRTSDEMNQTLRPGQSATDDKNSKAGGFNPADTLDISLRLRADDIQRQKAKRFDQAYLSESVLYLSGPADKNFGYNVEYSLASQSPAFNSAAGRYDVGPLESDLSQALVRYYNGKPGRYFSLKIGQVGPLDGYMGSDRTLSITGSLLFGTVNKISANRSQRDLDLGYTFGDNHLSVIALQGVPSNGDGTQSRPGNHYDWEFQYLRWLDKAGSSVLEIFHIGLTPVIDSVYLVDNFSQFYLLGNWRLPMHK